MRIEIEREALLRPLQQVANVVERRQTLPILANVLIRAEQGMLRVAGTDLEIEIVAETEAEFAGEGAFTVPARKLLDIWRALPEGSKITLSLERDRVRIQSAGSRFALATLPAQDFPLGQRAEGLVEWEARQEVLRRLLESTQFAMAVQDVRYYLNGLLLEVGAPGVRVVATDGHRLALCECEVEVVAQASQQFILPRKAVLELIRILEDNERPVRCVASPNQVRFELPGVTFTSKLVDGKFPDYERVIPDRCEWPLVVGREEIRRALGRAAILSNEKYRGVRLVLEQGSLRIVASNPEQEEAVEEVSVAYVGLPMEVGFNVSYLLDALGAVDGEEVEVHISDATSGCRIERTGGSNCRFVVMPMRL